jgi:acetolactate synthase-1/3 small subunit
MNQPGSAYFLEKREDGEERHTLSVIVDNEPGVLARVIGLFSGRGYNIDSVTVSETEHERHLSRITIVTTGSPMVIEQIKHQLERLVPIHKVSDLTAEFGELGAIERELALIKVAGVGDMRLEALRLAEAFEAVTVDATLQSFIFQLTGRTREVDRFIGLMREIGLVEVSRTGSAAMSRGAEGM